jgi:hypothetical protein
MMASSCLVLYLAVPPPFPLPPSPPSSCNAKAEEPGASTGQSVSPVADLKRQLSARFGLNKKPVENANTEAAHVPKPRPSTKKADRSRSVLLDEAERLHALLSAIRNVNAETSMEKAIAALVKETCSILSCDRATVFMVDNITDELVLRIASTQMEIRIPTTSGIAGAVYTSGKYLKIDDPYSDSRFNQNPDKESGYKTNSILCLPVHDGDGNIVSVLQAINKMDYTGNSPAPFEEVLCCAVCVFCLPCLVTVSLAPDRSC